MRKIFAIVALLALIALSARADVWFSSNAGGSSVCNGITLTGDVTLNCSNGVATVASIGAVLPGPFYNGTDGSNLSAATVPLTALATQAGGTVVANAGTTTVSPTATKDPVLGIPGTSTGSVTYASSGGGKITHTAPSTASNFTITDPAVTGTAAVTIASGAQALNTAAIASATCDTVVSATATGTLTTDVVQASFNGDPTAVTGYIPATAGMLTIIMYPTADHVNFKVCNSTTSSITPGAITMNWRVSR